MEKSLVIIKPDGVQRGLTGRIVQRFEDAGMKIIAMKMVWIDKDHAGKHYFDVAERHGQQVFQANVSYISEGPVVAIVLEGIGVIKVIRKIVGQTEPGTAVPGTIRGDFAHQSFEWCDEKDKAVRNLIHASSSLEDAEKEIKLWFSDQEIHDYKTVHEYHTF